MKSINDYTVVVAPNTESSWWAYVPAIPGCHAVADTPGEARAELENVFAMWVEEYEESGRALPDDVRELIAVAS